MNHEVVQTPEDKREYKEVVEQIKNLNWENLDGKELQEVMYLSYVSAREFAEALRIATRLYPDNANLKEMAQGELRTSNIAFDDYHQAGDHADFLAHFLKKYELEDDASLERHAEAYREVCRALPDAIRAMTIFSREEELSGIFKRILEAKDWSEEGLPAFRYYLAEHIALDAGEGGHAELTKEFPIDDRVKSFYEARLEMYKAVPKLFEEKD
ncbi:MAG: DUF3050 domain-containing protein [bacterium]|nr:DUF3050 domain-containing protein [bacterium]